MPGQMILKIVHDMRHIKQMYRQRVVDHWPSGVSFRTPGKQRHVLTTRRDGWIQFVVDEFGNFDIYNREQRMRDISPF